MAVFFLFLFAHELNTAACPFFRPPFFESDTSIWRGKIIGEGAKGLGKGVGKEEKPLFLFFFKVVEKGGFVITVKDVGQVDSLKGGQCVGELALLYNAPRAASVQVEPP